MLALVQTLAGLLCGGILGWLVKFALEWPEAPFTLAAAGCVGQVCRIVLAYTGRPSDETRSYQCKLTLVPVVASAVVGLGSIVTLLPFPATVVVPAASYLLVRVLLSMGRGSASGRGLLLAARGGEILTLIAAIIKD